MKFFHFQECDICVKHTKNINKKKKLIDKEKRAKKVSFHLFDSHKNERKKKSANHSINEKNRDRKRPKNYRTLISVHSVFVSNESDLEI